MNNILQNMFPYSSDKEALTAKNLLRITEKIHVDDAEKVLLQRYLSQMMPEDQSDRCLAISVINGELPVGEALNMFLLKAQFINNAVPIDLICDTMTDIVKLIREDDWINITLDHVVDSYKEFAPVYIKCASNEMYNSHFNPTLNNDEPEGNPHQFLNKCFFFITSASRYPDCRSQSYKLVKLIINATMRYIPDNDATKMMFLSLVKTASCKKETNKLPF